MKASPGRDTYGQLIRFGTADNRRTQLFEAAPVAAHLCQETALQARPRCVSRGAA